MRWAYAAGVHAYRAVTRLAGLGLAKARARSEGAARALDGLAPTPPGQDCYWMHCASVGEFEQGRPVWDAIRAARPGARFVVSFFSPSGYEHFAHGPDVGEVAYLPWDTGDAARRWVARLSPKLAVFVKYEYWYGYFAALRGADVPTVMISAVLRPDQYFFRGGRDGALAIWREAVQGLDRVFAQDEQTADLLRERGGVTRVHVTGDTRLDRALALRGQALEAPALVAWAKEQEQILVAGSTWPAGEELLAYALAQRPNLGVIVAPHLVGEADVKACLRRFEPYAPLRLSRLRDPGAGERLRYRPRVVVVDGIGLLSRLYRLGDMAYVGGGFGAGIHNTVEPAVYGLPVAFGPRHERFVEARQLLDAGIASAVSDRADVLAFVDRYSEPAVRAEVLAEAEAYFARHAGATDEIVAYLRERDLI